MADIDHDDGLTDEERAALQDGDDDTTGTDDTSADDAGASDDTNADDTNEAGNDSTDAALPADAAPGRDDGTDVTADAGSAPILVVDKPADADDQLKAIASQKEDLITKFDDGEITAKEYQQQLDALAKQEREIERTLERAALAAEMEQQRLKNEWTNTVNSFIAANPVYKDNARLYRALDQEVRDVANSDDGKTLTGAQILAKAHQSLAEAFGLQTNRPAAQQQRPPKADAPPSLHGVPAADANDVTGGKYAALDRLANTNPIAYEEALMKLPDAERDAYLASQ